MAAYTRMLQADWLWFGYIYVSDPKKLGKFSKRQHGKIHGNNYLLRGQLFRAYWSRVLILA